MSPEASYWHSLPLEDLRLKLKAERARGIAGHWTYDKGRHSAMYEVYRERVKACREGVAEDEGNNGAVATNGVGTCNRASEEAPAESDEATSLRLQSSERVKAEEGRRAA